MDRIIFENLFERVSEANKRIPKDFVGGSGLPKCFLMAYLVRLFNLKNYVEIGVYRGKSLFPVAVAIKENKGMAYGIDPYLADEAKEFDLENELKEVVNSFIDSLDFEQIYNDVILGREELGLSKYVEIVRKTSERASNYFVSKNISIDMLHIDGNHDTRQVELDVINYLPLVKDGGIIVFDDINWDSVKTVYNKVKEDYIILFEAETFGILIKQERRQAHFDKARILSRKLKGLYAKIVTLETESDEDRLPTVTVAVITYNHEKYIQQCLDSIVKQQGNFRLRIIIGDDNSTDNTAQIIKEFIAQISQRDTLSIDILHSDDKLGMVKNLKRLIRATQGQKSDYLSIIDGDDYWTDVYRLDKHINFMKKNPECVISFNSILFYWQNEDKYETFETQQSMEKIIFGTFDLVQSNIIGNISASFLDARSLNEIPDSLFEIFTGDWMLHIFLSQFGDIGYIKEPMTVYRKHDGGIWTGGNLIENRKDFIKNIDEYNKYLNFDYDTEFTIYRDRLVIRNSDKYFEETDLIIIDDIFPHPVSGFRYQEFTSYFQSINSVKMMTSCQCIHVVGKETHEEIITSYKRKYPETSGKLQLFTSWNDTTDCKLFYFSFLNLAYIYLSHVEMKRKPFAFTLYPGGGFALDNPDSDRKLKRVLKSPSFRKVIVTQKVTYDYLIDNKLCTSDKIQYIFGVVTPLEKLEMKYEDKKHYGIDKETLDICFVALKYTKYGKDKGYNVFIEVAKELYKKYNNIYFHVVGSFDENVIDVSAIKDRITFYGIQKLEWFDEFYKDKDIILSPNLPGIIAKGTFDGFPTGCCTEAGIRETAIFCTDELKLNCSNFKDSEEIVIIECNTSDIINKIEHYINNPNELRSLCINGKKKIKELYGFESQILPRINMLKDEISKPFFYNEKDFLLIEYKSLPRRVYYILKRHAPKFLKKLYHKIKSRY